MIDLLPLALRACTELDAQPVLGDAVLESGWYDQRVMELVLGYRNGYERHWGGWPDRWKQLTADRLYGRFLRRAAKPDRRWCRAVSAIMMFGSWSAEMWPISERVRIAPLAPADWGRILQELYPQDGIREEMYAPSPFFALLRKEDPVRLAGYRLEDAGDVRERIREAADLVYNAGHVRVDQRPNPLADVWDREMEGHRRGAQRIVDRVRAGLFAPSELRVNRRR